MSSICSRERPFLKIIWKRKVDRYDDWCLICNRYGHYASYYWHKDRENKILVDIDNGKEKTTLLLACCDSYAKGRTSLYLDTSASNYMCGNINFFVDLDEAYHARSLLEAI